MPLDRWGFAVTNNRYQTSPPGVFAAGDVRQGFTKQLGSAVGEGISAILQVRAFLKKTPSANHRGVNEHVGLIRSAA